MAPNGEAIPFNQRLAMAAVAGGCGGLVGTPGTYVIQNINQRLAMAMARYNSMYSTLQFCRTKIILLATELRYGN